MALDLKRRRFTAEEYHWMARVGILGEDDRVELVDGEIVEMTPIGHRHAACVNRLAELFSQTLGNTAIVSVQNPVRLGQYSEPQPDLALLRRKPDFYASGHPTPEDVFLIVEVAGSSIEPDRRVKIPLYARSGVLEAWLVELDQETLTMYRDPAPDGYHTVRVVRRGEQVAPAAFPSHSLAISDILP
ncbi:MAG: Uma2 family endonuclease [Chloroflexi bacterium]|nr:Uma2 family endonuclease [Chloroflexota bacterium]